MERKMGSKLNAARQKEKLMLACHVSTGSAPQKGQRPNSATKKKKK